MLGRSFLYGSHPFAEQFDSGSTRGEEERHMNFRLSRSMALRTILVVWVLIATAFAFMVTSQNAAAAARTNLVIGLQNDMVNLNPFDPGTNSVWKAYQTQYNFESLFTYDPNYQIYADLADPAAACPTGTTVAVPGSCVDASKLNITVNIRSAVTFTNGQTLTADDVVFTYQTLPWSTLATDIVQAIWWDHPVAPLWNSTANGATGAGACPSSNPKCSSHLGIFKTGPLQVRFQLTPHTVPGVTNGGYALVFYDTLVSSILPSCIGKNHLQSTPQISYSDPALGNIKDSVDQSIDFSFGGPGQYDATVGTGPLYMTSWTRNAGSKSLVYGNYWGKNVAHTWAGTSYPFSPPSDGKHVTEFDFIVYGSLDVVSLSLQQGTIDTLLWSLTPGFVNVVGPNPAITVQTVTDSGYFYLSFNTRVAPWNNLCLRQAISMAIDTIVAKAFPRPVNFQIYVLGWSLGLFPETYLCTFFCSNYDVNKNPAGQNSAGYSNPTVDALINQALYTTDTTARTAIVKHIEGLVAADIPWNVLYYRKNVVAWRNDAWAGWVLYPNGNAQFNFSTAVHDQPAATATVGGGP